MKIIPVLPAFGEPCNGCGQCCESELCGLADEVFAKSKIKPPSPPCPFLEWADGRYWCAVIKEADRVDIAYGAHLKWRLGVGVGCQMPR